LEVVHIQKALKLMNGFITEIFDKNLFYSRLSFLESSKNAIDIKYEFSKGKALGPSNFKLPSISKSYYQTSTLVSNLFQQPTEGNMRKRFSDNLADFKANLKKR
jgi:hypothetical protein